MTITGLENGVRIIRARLEDMASQLIITRERVGANGPSKAHEALHEAGELQGLYQAVHQLGLGVAVGQDVEAVFARHPVPTAIDHADLAGWSAARRQWLVDTTAALMHELRWDGVGA